MHANTLPIFTLVFGSLSLSLLENIKKIRPRIKHKVNIWLLEKESYIPLPTVLFQNKFMSKISHKASLPLITANNSNNLIYSLH
jgi:hypothetical protein